MLSSRQFAALCLKSGLNCAPVRTKICNYVTATATSAHIEPKWQLLAGACITRPPVICPPLTEEEARYRNLLEKMEDEKSLKSQHEMRVLDDQIRAHLSKEEVGSVSLEDAAKQTAAEFEDASTEELRNFPFASRVTEANKDKFGLNRALDKSLVLAVKQNFGSQEHWVLPQMPWAPGETLRDTCDRILTKSVSKDFKLTVLGNAPCGFYKYKYPKEIRKQGYVGAKVFFFSIHMSSFPLDGPNAEPTPEQAWLTHGELSEKLNKSYLQAISQFLVLDD